MKIKFYYLLSINKNYKKYVTNLLKKNTKTIQKIQFVSCTKKIEMNIILVDLLIKENNP